MALEDDFYNAILYYVQEHLSDTTPEGIKAAVLEVVLDLQHELREQGRRVVAELTADFAESEVE